MHNGLKCALAFSVGAAVGFAAAWKLLKAKYEQIAQEEIDSVREMYNNAQACDDTESVTEEATEVKPEAIEYAAAISGAGYANVKAEEVADVDKPRVISPEEFEELAEEYDVINLTYYSDNVLTDELDEPMDDIEGTVGRESLNHFGDYPEDPDTVYVRNDRLKTVYEICLDTQSYSEDPHLDDEE